MLDECFEAVINGRERDIRQAVLDAHENIDGCRVVPLLHQRAVNFLALTRHSEAGDFFRNLDFGWNFWVSADHRGGKLEPPGSISRIIPITIPGSFCVSNHRRREESYFLQ